MEDEKLNETPEEVPAEMPETTEEAATETPSVNILIAKMKSMHPDVEDEGELMNKAHDHMAELEDYKSRNEVSNAELVKIARQNPGLIKTLQMMKEGASWEEAVARNVDLSAIPVEGEPDYEKWGEMSKQREAEFAAMEEMEARLSENKARSIQNLKDLAAENGWSDEQAASFYQKTVAPTIEALANLDFSKEFLVMLHKAVTAEEDKAAAMEEGLTKGKNMRAEEIMQPEPVGDGLPKAPVDIVTEPVVKRKSYIDSLK